jgi:DDE superfamily endonuclease
MCARYSILPALSLDGILALEIAEGSFTKLTFASFIDRLLEHMNPFPEPNSVIVMDNRRIHKSELIQEMIHER